MTFEVPFFLRCSLSVFSPRSTGLQIKQQLNRVYLLVYKSLTILFVVFVKILKHRVLRNVK